MAPNRFPGVPGDGRPKSSDSEEQLDRSEQQEMDDNDQGPDPEPGADQAQPAQSKASRPASSVVAGLDARQRAATRAQEGPTPRDSAPSGARRRSSGSGGPPGPEQVLGPMGWVGPAAAGERRGAASSPSGLRRVAPPAPAWKQASSTGNGAPSAGGAAAAPSLKAAVNAGKEVQAAQKQIKAAKQASKDASASGDTGAKKQARKSKKDAQLKQVEALASLTPAGRALNAARAVQARGPKGAKSQQKGDLQGKGQGQPKGKKPGSKKPLLALLAGLFVIIPMMTAVLLPAGTITLGGGGGGGAGAPVGGVAGLVAAGVPEDAAKAYVAAAEKIKNIVPGCEVPAEVLAGHGKVESNHGNFKGSKIDPVSGDVLPPIIGVQLNGSGATANIPDTDGGKWDGDTAYDRAVGPMQFIPSSWVQFAEKYDADGNGDGKIDPNNYYDATLAAAVHLCTTPGKSSMKTEAEWRKAMFGYNHSQKYVDDVVAEVLRIRAAMIAAGGGAGSFTAGTGTFGKCQAPPGGWGPPVQGGLSKNAAAAKAFAEKQWPGLKSVGGWGTRQIGGKSDHPFGKANDYMVSATGTAASGAERELGNEIAAWFVANPCTFGTTLVIWYDQSTSGDSRGWHPYKHSAGGGNTLQHRDHPHVSFAYDTPCMKRTC